MPPNVGPRNLNIASYNTTSTLAVFQWDPIYYSNGPVTGYKFYIGDSDGMPVQGASNTTFEVSVRRDVEINVRVVAINSAGEGTPTVRIISLNGNACNQTFTQYLAAYVCHFRCPRNTTDISFKCVIGEVILGSTSIIHS